MRGPRSRPLLRVVAAALALVVLVPPTAGGAQEEGGQVSVRLEGVRGEVRRNVEQHLSVLRRTRGIELLEARIVRLHGRADAEIRTALQPFGYYRPQVDATLDRVGGRWRAHYRIRPGERVRYGQVDVEVVGPGADDPEIRREMARLPIRRGEPLRHPDWTRAKDGLLHRATARGYLDATLVEHRVDVDLESYEARAVLRMETGPRYRFGPVRFEGTAFRREFLRRFVPFDEDDPFLLAELLAVQSALATSPYFRRVEVIPLVDEARDRSVPLLISLQNRPRNGLGGGVGYGTDTGPRGTVTWERRWLSDAADRLQAEIQASFARRTGSLTYHLPVGRRPDDQVTLTAAVRDDESVEDARSRSAEVVGARTQGRGGWRETLSLTLKSEWFDVGGVESRTTLILPQAGWTRRRADDAAWPARASRLSLWISGTDRAVGSDVSFLQADLGGRVIRPGPVEGGRVLARMEVGVTAVDDFDALPVSHRFFAGGDVSVRGFGYRSISPRSPAGDPVGGRHLFTASLEYAQRIWRGAGLAVFGDTGAAFGSLADVPTLERGVGVGARWASPVGPVSLDVAWAVSRPGDPVRVHFSVGGSL